METKYRAQILLEPAQHAALAEAARQANRSISDLVREIVGQWLSQHDLEGQRQRELLALEALTQLRLKIKEERGIYQGNLIDEVRDERDDDIRRVWQGEA